MLKKYISSLKLEDIFIFYKKKGITGISFNKIRDDVVVGILN